MTEYILLIISTALINNVVLVKFLGLCPFMGVSKKVETAIGMGLATTFVLTMASLCSYLVETYLLAPLNAVFCAPWCLFWLSPSWCNSPKW